MFDGPGVFNVGFAGDPTVSRTFETSQPMDPRFSRKAFLAVPDAGALSAELAQHLTERLRTSEDSSREQKRIIADLRALGHDLYSWDESGEWVLG